MNNNSNAVVTFPASLPWNFMRTRGGMDRRADSVTSQPALNSFDFAKITHDPTNIPEVYEPGWKKNGEYRLLAAILEDALDVISKYRTARADHLRVGRGTRREYHETIEWIQTVGVDNLMTFDSVCHVVGIEPSTIRKAVLCDGFMLGHRLRHNNAGHHGRSVGKTGRKNRLRSVEEGENA